jgi:hypothetical protein
MSFRNTPTPTPSVSPTISLTPSNTPSYTPTGTVCPGATPTMTSTPTLTSSPTGTINPTPTQTGTIRETPTQTSTPSATPSLETCTDWQIYNGGFVEISWSGIRCGTETSVGGTISVGQTIFTGCIKDGTLGYTGSPTITVSAIC